MKHYKTPHQPLQTENPSPSGNRSFAKVPRIILGIIVGIFSLPVLFGAHIVAESYAELATIMLLGAVALGGIPLMAFVVRPTQTTRILAIIGLAIWFAVMLFATIESFPESWDGVSASEIAFVVPMIVLGNLLGPIVASVCVFFISRSMKKGD